MTTSDNANSPSSSSASPSPKSNDESVEMISVKPRLVHQDTPMTSAVRENPSGPADLADRVIDMSPPMRSPPSAVAVQDGHRSYPHISAQDQMHLKTSDQWVMNNGHVNSGATIHRKSFNIDALLAKSQTDDQQKERFVGSPDSANDCYNEDRRDFTPSPDGHHFRWVESYFAVTRRSH